VNNTANYTFGGTIQNGAPQVLQLGQAGTLVLSKSGSGQLTLSGASNGYTGGTMVSAGMLVTNSNLSNGTITVAGGVARVAQHTNNGDPSGVTIVPSVSISAPGVLDLTNNGMVVDYDPGNSPIATIAQYLANGRAGGAWNGTNGINSSTAATFNATADPHKRAIVFAEASALGIVGSGTFLGQAVDDSALLMRYTVSGDANLDGVTNGLDFNALATNFGGTTGAIADFNFDGIVNMSDFTILAQGFNSVLPAAAPAPTLGSLLPEPATLAAAAVALSIGRRRRRIE
jgi:autotransporter-associated beta strand protein